MGKFNFSKKGEGDEDSNRLALFGSRSKNKSPNQSVNPYAVPPGPAKTSDAYLNAKSSVVGGGLPSSPSLHNRQGNGGPLPGYGNLGGTNNQYPEDKKQPGGPDNYGGGGGGYSAGGYGTQNGYGNEPYGARPTIPQNGSTGSRYGPSGYGGLGRVDSASTEENRNALFGGARERAQHRTEPGSRPGQPQNYGQDNNPPSGTYGGEPNYEAYGDRQLTAEEEEEEDIQASKQEMRFMKQADVSSTRNALAIAAQAEETGRNTLARIGVQGDRIHNTEKNLDLTSNHNQMAEDKAKELKRLNGSMFAVHVSNPFTSSSRREERDRLIMDRHRSEREQREQTRTAGFQTNQRMQKNFKDIEANNNGRPNKNQQSSLAERAKYQFEADSEDEDMENEIDANIDALSGAAGRLNMLAQATGKELDEQNRHLERINQKVCYAFARTHYAQTSGFANFWFSPEHESRRRDCYEQGAFGSYSLRVDIQEGALM